MPDILDLDLSPSEVRALPATVRAYDLALVRAAEFIEGILAATNGEGPSLRVAFEHLARELRYAAVTQRPEKGDTHA